MSKNNDDAKGMDFLQSLPRRWVTIYIPITLFVIVLLLLAVVIALICKSRGRRQIDVTRLAPPRLDAHICSASVTI